MKKSIAQNQAISNFRTIYAVAKSRFRDIEKATGLSGSQLWILQQVSLNPGIGISELAKVLMIHVSTCSLLVDKVVLKGLINKKRCGIDTRKVGLVLTDEAQAILSKSPKSSEGLISKTVKKLDEAEVIALNVLLAKIVQLMKAENKKFKIPAVDM